MADKVKKAGKEIGKLGKKIHKGTKRNWKKILMIVGISVLALSLILFVTGWRIRFAFQNELIVNLESSGSSFTTTNKESKEVVFDVSVKNSIACVANCSYVFYDRSEDKILDNGNVMLKDLGSFSTNYVLVPPNRGSGQKIYNFEIECSNIKSFVCWTLSPNIRRSSFITLNYELTKEEESLKLVLMDKITKSFGRINNASRNMQIAIYILNTSVVGFDYFIDKFSTITKKLDYSLNQTKRIFELWSDEMYLKIDEEYNSFLQDYSLYDDSETLLDNITGSIGVQNDLVEKYNLLKDYFLKLTEETFFDETSDSDYIYNQLKNINIRLEKEEYSSIDDYRYDLNRVSILVEEFNKSIWSVNKGIISKGHNISSFEFSKKCGLGYCENTSDDFCSDLKNIIDEYKNDTYEILTGINVSEFEFYRSVGDNISINISNESSAFYMRYCQREVFTAINDSPRFFFDTNITTFAPIKNELSENLPMCCVYGECAHCCTEGECVDDPRLYPVILIHGHALLREVSPEPLLDVFNKIQFQMQEDGYVNAGRIRFEFNATDYRKNDWALLRSPIVAVASYYYDYFYSLGKYIYITKSTDNIDTYAIRLNEIVKLVKYRTGKKKVNIIAHSMGGLVARRYLQIFGEENVNKLILIGTPNKGIVGNVESLCHVVGEKRECEDMYGDSVFLKKLNDPYQEPEEANIYTISGKGCDMEGSDGDGVVVFNNSLLDYAKSFIINGKCDDAFNRGLHTDMLNIDKYPDVYKDIKQILNISSQG
ncbi:MAG: alpha/beta fold hydrolase [Nanoarchaeota archaeon]